MSSLEAYINTLSAFGQETSMRAQYAVNNATKTLNDVIAAKNNATAMQQITTNAGDIQNRAAQLMTQADDLNRKVLAHKHYGLQWFYLIQAISANYVT